MLIRWRVVEQEVWCGVWWRVWEQKVEAWVLVVDVMGLWLDVPAKAYRPHPLCSTAPWNRGPRASQRFTASSTRKLCKPTRNDLRKTAYSIVSVVAP